MKKFMKLKTMLSIAGIIALVAVMGTTVACSKKTGAQVGGRAPKESPASDFNYQGWKYEGIDGVWITKYTGKGGAVVIPATIEGLPVLGLGHSAFHGAVNTETGEKGPGINITSVYIPESVKVIGQGCFWGNGNLKSVTIMGSNVLIVNPHGFGSLEYYSSAFQDCKNLTTVTFMGAPVYLGRNAFLNCENLTELNFPDVENAILPYIEWLVANPPDDGAHWNNARIISGSAFQGATKLPLATRAKLREWGFNIQ